MCCACDGKRAKIRMEQIKISIIIIKVKRAPRGVQKGRGKRRPYVLLYRSAAATAVESRSITRINEKEKDKSARERQ